MYAVLTLVVQVDPAKPDKWGTHDEGEIGGWGANSTGGGFSAGLGTTGANTGKVGGTRFYATASIADWQFAVRTPSTYPLQD